MRAIFHCVHYDNFNADDVDPAAAGTGVDTEEVASVIDGVKEKGGGKVTLGWK